MDSRTCLNCGEDFDSRVVKQIYCSLSCSNKHRGFRGLVDWNNRTIAESINHSTPRTKFVHIRKHARKVMEQDIRPKKCEVCNFDVVVEVCHIKAVAEFDESALLSEVNNPKNLMYLCPNHHAMLDKGLLHGHVALENVAGFQPEKKRVQLSSCPLHSGK